MRMISASSGTQLDLWDGGDVRPAVCLGEDKGRIKVVTVQGRALKVPESRVANVGGEKLDAGADPVLLGEQLRKLEKALHAAAEEVDLESLWEILADDGGDYELDELADLALGSRSGGACSVLLRKLLTDELYFTRKRLLFRPRTREDLGQTIRRVRAEELRAAQRAQFVATARSYLDVPGPEPPAWSNGAGRFLETLTDVAVHGLESTRIKDAQALLTELGAEHRGEPALSAFDILYRLRVLDRDENLLLRKHGVERSFSAEVLAAAEAARATDPLGSAARRDLTDLACFAIDDVETSEVDDAISVELGDDGLRLGVHIADPEPFVPLGGVLDQAARDRGTTFYLPTERILMLPPAVSEDVASLEAGVDRAALSVLVELGCDGDVRGTEMVRSRIRVARRLTYEQTDALIAAGGGAPALYEDAAQTPDAAVDRGAEAEVPSGLDADLPARLAAAARLARVLLERRAKAGALILKGPDLEVKVSDGDIRLRRIEPWSSAWVLVSEAMVLANWLAARKLRDAEVPAIYRRQAHPDQPIDVPRHYDPAAAAQARRRIKPSELSLTPGPHAGLGVDVYVQCTSPLRRYQDLVCHRQLEAALTGEPSPYDRDELWAIVQGCGETERAAREIERGNREYWLLRHLESLPPDTVIDAVITRPDERRTLVELEPYPYFAQLPPRPGHKPGRRLRVVIDAVNPRAGRLLLREA